MTQRPKNVGNKWNRDEVVPEPQAIGGEGIDFRRPNEPIIRATSDGEDSVRPVWKHRGPAGLAKITTLARL